jgi:hypothetical protein
MKRAAICFSGHLRGFIECFQNIKDNLIDPLTESDFTIDYFVSIWDTEGHRHFGFGGKADIDTIIECINPKCIVIEKFDRKYFLDTYNTSKWIEYRHLDISDETTCGDAVSMWYKVQSCLNMVENFQKMHGFVYDAVIRARSDVLFNAKISRDVIEDIKTDCVYIPKWHGKWPEISNTITDYFGIGNFKTMQKYMSVFDNINDFIAEDECPHTGEGFLWANLILKNIPIKRLEIGFSVKRKNNVELVVE